MTPTLATAKVVPASLRANAKRYFQFSLLLLAAGSIYPLLYLRQSYEITVLKAFDLTSADLNGFYAILGVVYALSYLPSGWLADKFSPRLLIAFSLWLVGALGFWFSTYPSKMALSIIFTGWGIAAGLTFWAALIKGVKLLAESAEQGRFFGILDGGRGLIEAVLATIAVSIFAYMSSLGAPPQEILQPVIYLYSITCVVIGVLVLIFLSGSQEDRSDDDAAGQDAGAFANFLAVVKIPQIWLLAFIVFTGYQLFWATYSFSAYLQEGYQVTAVAAGVIIVAKLWTRPLAGIAAGFLGDHFSSHLVLATSMTLASLGLLSLGFFPQAISTYVLLIVVILIGGMTYAVRGLYWALLDGCNVSVKMAGMAIGVVSVIGYLPDVFLPMINVAIMARYPGVEGYHLYYSYIAVCGLLGAGVSVYFGNMTNTKKAEQ
jgi:sugar phosphate permease